MRDIFWPPVRCGKYFVSKSGQNGSSGSGAGFGSFLGARRRFDGQKVGSPKSSGPKVRSKNEVMCEVLRTLPPNKNRSKHGPEKSEK